MLPKLCNQPAGLRGGAEEKTGLDRGEEEEEEKKRKWRKGVLIVKREREAIPQSTFIIKSVTEILERRKERERECS